MVDAWTYRIGNLSVGYGDRALLRGLAMEIVPGECIFMCGTNGSGKSTLLKTLAGIVKPVSGNCGYVGRNKGVFLIPGRIPKVSGFTAEEFVATLCYRETDWLGRMPGKVRSDIRNALASVGLAELVGRDISSLSDGEFQKAGIAAALVQRSGIVLLDEPTAFLDVDSRENVLSVISGLASESAGRSVIFSSHDVDASLRHCTRVWGISRPESAADAVENILTDSGKNVAEQEVRVILSRCFSSFAASAVRE